MQTESAKIISLFAKKKVAVEIESEEEFEELFTDTIKKNIETKRRLENARKKANKSVIRSYRLKK